MFFFRLRNYPFIFIKILDYIQSTMLHRDMFLKDYYIYSFIREGAWVYHSANIEVRQQLAWVHSCLTLGSGVFKSWWLLNHLTALMYGVCVPLCVCMHVQRCVLSLILRVGSVFIKASNIMENVERRKKLLSHSQNYSYVRIYSFISSRKFWSKHK